MLQITYSNINVDINMANLLFCCEAGINLVEIKARRLYSSQIGFTLVS